jgi:hypothetical protein
MDGEAVGIEIPESRDGLCTVVYGDKYELLRARYEEESRDLAEDERDRIFRTAEQVLGQCPDPYGPPARRTGLALGKVQSGKTMSYITLSALAFDSGYRVVIVLAGRTKPLAAQNMGRFEEELIDGRSVPKIATFHNPNAQRDEAEIQSVLESDKLVLITLLKNQSRIAEVRDLFASQELSRYPTLIIDDEGDQASHNVRRRRGGQSAVHANILQMRDAFPLHAYVAYTATPQANLLIPTIDVLSPEFCVLVEPGRGYTGGSTFFGPDRDRYIRIVPDDEAQHDDHGGVPDHLRLAIATFLVAGAILHLRDPSAFHSMLIHNSNRRDIHDRLHGAVGALITGWKEALLLPDTDPGAQGALDLARRAYEDLRDTVRECPSWETVSERLRHEVRDLKVWLVNSLPLGTNPSTTPFNLQNNIMIGGNMLDRGVTVPGLAITYITRQVGRNPQADTVEQRARWFGYKERYLDLCRIFTSREIVQTYTELLSHEDDLWESLARWQRQQGLEVTEWPRLLRLGLGVRPTRTSIARTRAFRSGEWLIQSRPPTDPRDVSRNVSAVRAFFRSRSDVRPEQYGNLTHQLAPRCEPEAVASLLADMSPTEEQDWDSSYVIEYLERLALSNRLLEMDVLLIDDQGQPRERTKTPLGYINPMQGRTPGRSPSDPRFYPGDRNIHNGRVQLQAHRVRVRDRDGQPYSDETIALALYVPPDPRYDLGQLIVPSGA